MTPPARPPRAETIAAAIVEPGEPIALAVVGGPARVRESLGVMLAGERSHVFRSTHVEHSPDALELLERGGFDCVIVFDDLTGRAVLRGMQERSIEVPAVCIVEQAAAGERATIRARMRLEGAMACVFAEDLTAPLVELALLHAVESRRLVDELLGDTGPARGSRRAAFLLRVGNAIFRARVEPRYRFSVVWIDAGRFAALDELVGRTAADALRRQFEDRLRRCMETSGTIARMDGDAHALLIEDPRGEGRVLEVVEQVQRVVAAAFMVGDEPVFVRAAVGVAAGGGRDPSPEVVLERAIETSQRSTSGAMVDAAALSSAALRVETREPLPAETALRKALERGEFSLGFQPIVELERETLVGFEALIRWDRPDGKSRAAASFIAEAERSALIVPIGYWALESAMRQMAEWDQEFELEGAVSIGINLSGQQVLDPLLVARIRSLLMTTGIEARAVAFEIGQDAVVDHPFEVRTLVQRLSELGVGVWLEDFGTGACTLADLRGMPLCGLKIDREIVAAIDGTEAGSAGARKVVDAARSLRIRVLAEGVENRLQANVLRWLGCPVGQGYHYDHPLAVGEAYARLARG